MVYMRWNLEESNSPGIAKFTETERRRVVVRGWGRGDGDLLVNGRRH